jgi:hypothetical protein
VQSSDTVGGRLSLIDTALGLPKDKALVAKGSHRSHAYTN